MGDFAIPLPSPSLGSTQPHCAESQAVDGQVAQADGAGIGRTSIGEPGHLEFQFIAKSVQRHACSSDTLGGSNSPALWLQAWGLLKKWQ